MERCFFLFCECPTDQMKPADSELIERELDTLAAFRKLENKEHDKRIARRVGEWLLWRESHLGLRGRDANHLCSLDCREHIRKLDNEMPLYGCDIGGKHHYCRKSSATCHTCYIDKDCSYFCVYTGFCVGKQEAVYRYFNRNKLGRGVRSPNYGCMGPPADDDDLSQLLVQQELQEQKAPLLLKQSRGGKKRKRRAGYNPARKKKKGIDLMREAERILDRILWETTPRKKLYGESLSKAKKRYGPILKSYVLECIRENQRISISAMDQIADSQMQSVGPVPLGKDLSLHRLYSSWIVRMWDITQSVNSEKRVRFSVRFDQHAIGLLYRLRRADIIKEDERTHEKIILLERDPWLEENLPDQKDLTHFGQKNGKDLFTKSDITSGIKHLVIALLYCEKDPRELWNILWNRTSTV